MTNEFNAHLSCGIAQYRHGSTADDPIEAADRALSQAKTSARNRVCAA